MDDIVEDARRETEVLLSIWKTRNHGRDHDHGYIMAVICSYRSLVRDDGECGNGKSGQRGAERHIFIGEARDTRSLSSVCPRHICIQDSLAEETSLGARIVTWGSCAGHNVRVVFAAPKFVETTAGK